MGLDIRKPIGLLFVVIALELLVSEAWKAAGGGSGGSVVNLWCAAAFGVFGSIFLWLSRSAGGVS